MTLYLGLLGLELQVVISLRFEVTVPRLSLLSLGLLRKNCAESCHILRIIFLAMQITIFNVGESTKLLTDDLASLPIDLLNANGLLILRCGGNFSEVNAAGELLSGTSLDCRPIDEQFVGSRFQAGDL